MTVIGLPFSVTLVQVFGNPSESYIETPSGVQPHL